jgi:hypothetical protein
VVVAPEQDKTQVHTSNKGIQITKDMLKARNGMQKRPKRIGLLLSQALEVY